MSFALRGYQRRAIEELRARFVDGYTRLLLVLPTGGGKTKTACALLDTAQRVRGRKCLWLVHRRELVDQASAALSEVGVRHGVILAGRRTRSDLPMQVASVQTLTARGEAPDGMDVVVVDEAHHATNATYRAILGCYPNVELVLGLTATPERGDGTALGDAGFDGLVVGASVLDLVDLWRATGGREGLVPCRVRAPKASQDARAADPAELTARLVLAGKRPVVFARDVADAERICAGANDRLRGTMVENAVVCVDGKIPKDIRRERLARLADGCARAVVNVLVLTEGWDLPVMDTVVLASNVSVWAAWLQKIGRGMRPAPGKSSCEVYDLHGAVHSLGLPDDPHEFSLVGRPVRDPAEAPPSIRSCPACLSVSRSLEAGCPFCGALLPPRPAPKLRGAALVDVNRARPAGKKYEKWLELCAEARAKGWKDKAALMRFKGIFGHAPPWPKP